MKVVFDFTNELLWVYRESSDNYSYSVLGLMKLLQRTLETAGLKLRVEAPPGELPRLVPAHTSPQAQFTVHPIRSSSSQYSNDGNAPLRLALLNEFRWSPDHTIKRIPTLDINGHVFYQKPKRVKDHRRPTGRWPLESLPKIEPTDNLPEGESLQHGVSEGNELALARDRGQAG